MNDYFGCRAVVALVRWGGASALLFSGARDALDASNVIGNGPAERTGKPVVVVVFLDARRFVSCDPGTVASRGAVSGASVKANPKVRAGSNDPPQDSTGSQTADLRERQPASGRSDVIIYLTSV